ncbi:MAG: GNAT family N-acetyltransferase [Candidatus Daviesbacteria bacterium]|nr:GNAT family N-acetyltransferase [Candidatus Daviesbacteria bacterium]
MKRLSGVADQARLSDAKSIQKLVNHFADQDRMLHRKLKDIRKDIGDFIVYRMDGEVVGCAALHRLSDNLAEIRAVAVREKDQKHGIGRKLVEACLEKAQTSGIPDVLLLTYEPGYFGRFGFEKTKIKIENFHHKLYGECLNRPKGPPGKCGEIAMVYHLS